MKKDAYLKEIKELPVAELQGKARGLAEELMKLRFRKAGSQLEQTHRLRDVQRNLARVKTVLAQKAQSAVKSA
jgi:large subunit ribosomal protein L29